MRQRQILRRLAAAATMAALLGVSASVLAQDSSGDQGGQGSLEQRVSRLERKLKSQGLVDMLSRIDQLQSEVERLRGEIEVQNHSIDELKRRQRDLYADIDRRLSQLERGAPSAGGGSASSGGQSPSSSAGAAAAAATTAATAAKPSSSASAPQGGQASGGGGNTAAKEQQAYQKAFDLLRELRYDQAISAFRKFLDKYPHGRYAHIAQYWVAEANYAQRHFKQAIGDYQKLIKDYPHSPKRAEAMLKIGYSYYELGDMDQAKSVLNDLMKSFPKTTESGQAQNLLQKIKVQAKRGQ